MRFSSFESVSVENHLTGRAYQLVRASDICCETTIVARMVATCNEPEVYDGYFRENLGGRPYTEHDARYWLKRSGAQWSRGICFHFAVVDEMKMVAAACYIRGACYVRDPSYDDSGEIGYWASQGHRGVMTNAITAMCVLAADAGFRRLFARTDKGNAKSQAVLARAGFVWTRSGITYERFEVSLDGKGDGLGDPIAKSDACADQIC